MLDRHRHFGWIRPLLISGLCGACLIPALPGPAAAQDATLVRQAVGDRIVIAGRQRMLAEGMAAKLCLLAAGIAPAANRRELYTMWHIFRWYHDGLNRGNFDLGLTRESDSRVLRDWAEIDQVWAGLGSLHESVLDGATPDADMLATTMQLTSVVTDGATRLVATLRSAYAKDLGPQGFGAALLIDLYERQRMLAQQMLKQVCLISAGDGDLATLARLVNTQKIFVASLGAFQNGLPEAGVPPPPNEAIAARLAAAEAHWSAVAPLVVTVAQRPLDDAELARFAEGINRFTAEMTGALNALTKAKAG